MWPIIQIQNTCQPKLKKKKHLNIWQLVQNLKAQGTLDFYDGEDDDGDGYDDDDDDDNGDDDRTCPAMMSVSL